MPVCLIPQLLFSKLIMPQKALEGLVAALEQATLAKWSYAAMEAIVATPVDAWALARSLGVLAVASAGLVATAGLVLRVKELGDG